MCSLQVIIAFNIWFFWLIVSCCLILFEHMRNSFSSLSTSDIFFLRIFPAGLLVKLGAGPEPIIHRLHRFHIAHILYWAPCEKHCCKCLLHAFDRFRQQFPTDMRFRMVNLQQIYNCFVSEQISLCIISASLCILLLSQRRLLSMIL